MALTVARSTFIRMGGMGNWLGKQVHPLNASKMAAVAPIQVAGMSRMRATYGEKYPYEKPWDYKNKTFNTFFQLFDSTEARLNENSKVIVVEGNVGVGKNEFAKRLAAGFDLNYIGSVPDSDCFKVQGYDLRELDEMLPPTAKFYDLKRFLADPNPEKGLAGRLQLQWYHEKFIKYAEGLQHLFNTGRCQVCTTDRVTVTLDLVLQYLLVTGQLAPRRLALVNSHSGQLAPNNESTRT